MEAGTGEIVSNFDIEHMSKFIATHGEVAFSDAIWNGMCSEVSFAYIHPCDEMRATENFSIIQKAFINAYC